MIEVKRNVKEKTPMLEKLSAVRDKSQSIGEFIEWMGNRDPPLFLCEIDEDSEQYYPTYPNVEKLLAEFFDIDLNKVEEERRLLLDSIRKMNKDA